METTQGPDTCPACGGDPFVIEHWSSQRFRFGCNDCDEKWLERVDKSTAREMIDSGYDD